MTLSTLPDVYSTKRSWEDGPSDAVRYIKGREELCKHLERETDESRFEFVVLPRSLSDYQNIFQTSELNKGVRIEIDKTGTIGALAGTPNNQYIAVGSGPVAVIGKEIKIRVRVVAQSGVYLRVGDAPETFTPGLPQPACDRILLGQGFDQTRIFDGTVSSTMSIGESQDLVPLRKQARLLGQILLFSSFLVWALRRDEQPANAKNDPKDTA
jgi:hypothetical protein